MKNRLFLLLGLMAFGVVLPVGAQTDGEMPPALPQETQVETPMEAQSVHPWQPLLDEMTTLDDTEQTGWEEMFDVLCQLEEHPLNINSASREQLEQIPFLNAQQVEDIQAYIYQYGAMKSLG